jgi:sarcosine oxidase subunit alpha
MLARLSFSGERAYEVFAGAHHGVHVWEHILQAGAAHGIVPYGTEAMGTLRIEKGHVSGPELDGRTSLDDLGLSGLASAKKPFVGGVMRQRAALREDTRARLVGLRSIDGRPIRPGAQLVAGNGPEGHVTSTTYSPELGAQIALALLRNGPARQGERLDAAYPLRGETVKVEVVPPVFLDPEGRRMRG